MKDRRGLIHIYCGDGKGKTTASVGLAVRAAGRGKKILFVRFMKHDDSGEVEILKQISGVVLMPCEKAFGFSYQMSEEERATASRYYGELLTKVWKQASDEAFDMLVMDEVLVSCACGMVDEDQLYELLRTKPERLEVVMTGRGPSQRLCGLADYVSEIQKRKHPFDDGTEAREGIEY